MAMSFQESLSALSTSSSPAEVARLEGEGVAGPAPHGELLRLPAKLGAGLDGLGPPERLRPYAFFERDLQKKMAQILSNLRISYVLPFFSRVAVEG